MSTAIEKLKTAIKNTKAILVGAGSGFSTAAGYTYSGERFQKHFADFIEKYHFRDMYSAGFYPFPTPEEKWAYWSRHIYYNRYDQPESPVHKILLEEMPRYKADAATFPDEIHAQRRLLRSLMNLRHPGPISSDFLREQDILLQDEAANKGVVKPDELPTIADETSKDITPQDAPARNLILWHGDITRLAADAIVKAANSAMLGCFAPCHGCIDNAIHSAAGLQLREACAQLMEQQGHPEPTGQAQITPTYNLPSKFVLHHKGPPT